MLYSCIARSTLFVSILLTTCQANLNKTTRSFTNTTTPSSTSTITSFLSTGLSSTAGNSNSLFANVTTAITYSGDCWDQWNEYWTFIAYLSAMSQSEIPIVSHTTWIQSQVQYEEDGEETFGTPTTYIETDTVTVVAGTIDGDTYTTTATVTDTPSGWTDWTSSTYYELVTRTDKTIYASWTPTANLSVKTPPCTLPSIVQQCQSSWEAYENARFPPSPVQPLCASSTHYDVACSDSIVAYNSSSDVYWSAAESSNHIEEPTALCTAASITGSLCNSLTSSVSSYLLDWEDVQTVAASDASQILAPGCSWGCQQCRITGSNVKLLYWPLKTSTTVGSNATLSSNGSILQPVTAVIQGTTFTSPTVYISFDTLYASDSCSLVGTTYKDRVVAITKSTDLSSVWGRQGPYMYKEWVSFNTASFNFTDLAQTPVPNSIYNLQPRCASAYCSEYADIYTSCDVATATNWSCPRVLPYEPNLSIPAEVFALDPSWLSCQGALNGVYDPPEVLTPVSALLAPTTSVSKPASPASTAQGVAASTSSSSLSTTSLADSPSTAALNSASQSQQSIPTSRVDTGVGSISSVSAPPAEQTEAGSTSISPNAIAGYIASLFQSAEASVSSLATSTTSNDVAAAIMSMLQAGTSPEASSQSDQSGDHSVLDTSGVDGNNSPSFETTVEGGQDGIAASTADSSIDTNAPTKTTQGVNEGDSSVSAASSTTGIAESSPGSNGKSSAGSADIGSPSSSGGVVTVNNQVYTAVSLSDGLIVDSQTLKNGGPAATINGQVVSVASSYLIVDTSSHALSEINHGLATTTDTPVTADSDNNAGAVFVNAGTTLTAVKVAELTGPSGEVTEGISVAGTTLVIGGPVLTLGTEVLSANSGGLMFSDSASSQVLAVPVATNVPTSSVKTITYATNGNTYTAVVDLANNREAVVDGSVILSLGGAAVTLNGDTMSLASEGLVMDQTSTVQIVGTTAIAATEPSRGVLSSSDNVSETDGQLVNMSTASTGPVGSSSKGSQATKTALSSGGKTSSDGASTIHNPRLDIRLGLLLALTILTPHF